MNDGMNEQVIKNSLYNMSLEENRYLSQQFLHTFQKSNYLPYKSYSFREVSDWSDRYKVQQSEYHRKNIQFGENNNQVPLSFPHFSFLISKRHRGERQNASPTPIKKQIELSPVNVKFYSQKGRKAIKKQDSISCFKAKEGNASFYESNYKPLSMLYQIKTNKKKQHQIPKTQELPVVFPNYNQLKLPKTERTSSIIRLMKKHQQIRALKSKYVSPQKLQLIKLP